jgi:hypothetical protein
MERNFEPFVIDGEPYYSVKQYALLTFKTTATIYNLIKKGNRIRKLKCRYIETKPMIPITEVTEFPFLSPGPNGIDKPYYYNADGTIREAHV